MEKSMWTSFLAQFPPEEAVEQFAAMGWTHLELSTEHGAALLERGNPTRTGRKFCQFTRDLGIVLPQGHLKLQANIALPSEAERKRELDELKGWLDLFAEVGVRAAVLHPGAGAPGGPGAFAPRVFETNVASLEELVRHARDDVTICLENGSRAGDLLRLISAAGGQGLGICLDTGHLALGRARHADGAQCDYEFITEAGGVLMALHITDNDGSRDQHLLPYGGGLVDWPGVMKGLQDTSYAGIFNFEIPGERNRPFDELLAVLDRASNIADTLMATMGERVS
jgi:sugar phosphate isomerase/epimerase